MLQDRISHALLLVILDYDPETGVFRWKECINARAIKGNVAGCSASGGYRRVPIFGRTYHEHNLAWYYVTGEWPAHLVDHINGIRDDNRFSNLRAADYSKNNANRRRNRGKALPKGVFFDPRAVRNKYGARITHQGKVHSLGCYPDVDSAAKAYSDAAHRFFGEFARCD